MRGKCTCPLAAWLAPNPGARPAPLNGLAGTAAASSAVVVVVAATGAGRLARNAPVAVLGRMGGSNGALPTADGGGALPLPSPAPGNPAAFPLSVVDEGGALPASVAAFAVGAFSLPRTAPFPRSVPDVVAAVVVVVVGRGLTGPACGVMVTAAGAAASTALLFLSFWSFLVFFSCLSCLSDASLTASSSSFAVSTTTAASVTSRGLNTGSFQPLPGATVTKMGSSSKPHMFLPVFR